MWRVPAGVVNQTIKSIMTRNCFVDQMLNLHDLGNIASDKPRFAWPTFGYFGSERIAFLLVTRTEDNLRARGDKSANATFANSFASASDDHDFVPIDHVRFLQFRFAQKKQNHDFSRGHAACPKGY